MRPNSALLVFQLMMSLRNRLIILQPQDVSEVFVTTDFSSIIKTNYKKPEWPKDWRRMNLQKINDTRVFLDESDIYLKHCDSTFLYYKLRFVFTNRTALDIDWIPVLWNSDINYSDTYYSSYLTFLIMFCVLLFIILTLLIFIKCKIY